MSRRTHWLNRWGYPACGSQGRLTTSTNPDDIDCGGCIRSWALAIGGWGCVDERRRKPAPRDPDPE